VRTSALALALSIVAGLDPNFTAVAPGIDGLCDFYLPKAAPADIVYLERSITGGTPGTWERTTAAGAAAVVPVPLPTPARTGTDAATPTAAGGALAESPATAARDTVTIVRDHGSIVWARELRVTTAPAMSEDRDWCYIGGKLSRTTLNLVLGEPSATWHRRRYYGDDLDEPLTQWTELNGAPPRPRKDPKPAQLSTPDAYGTPDKLPFFGAYQSLATGTLTGTARATRRK
jgi:hypothetical protein